MPGPGRTNSPTPTTTREIPKTVITIRLVRSDHDRLRRVTRGLLTRSNDHFPSESGDARRACGTRSPKAARKADASRAARLVNDGIWT